MATDNDTLATKIGQDKGVQNPQDAIESETGKYKDSGDMLSEDDKLFVKQLPQGPEKAPFANMKTAGGSR